VITDPSPWIDRCAWNKELCVHDYQPMDGYIDVPDLPGIGNQLSEYALQTAFTGSSELSMGDGWAGGGVLIKG
jgi:hypothetical protein